ncbi:hypothetical protein ACFSUL_20890 [Bacillus seohaeanensis]|uniref:Carbohydrate kinase PfkB domain-containing protein n=1 Tax=Bacillus seohaeanensis TaxID=284580 RepID=A0ABW5RWU9_9BACI
MADTTGSKDTFNGVLAVSLLEGINIKEACQIATTAVPLSVTNLERKREYRCERK